MKVKSLLALALTLITIGLSLPAIAREGDDNDRNRDRKSGQRNQRNNYYGKYHYYKLTDGSHIYIGSKGDYFDSNGKYYPDSDSTDYERKYNTSYDYSKGDYYESGKYYRARQERNSDRNYYGKYHYYKLTDSSHIYIGSKGDHFDSNGKYYPDSDSTDYERKYDRSYDYSKGDYYESGKYYRKSR